jgi:uncharacterized membrane protein YphA (DoxX/SURF4 family)
MGAAEERVNGAFWLLRVVLGVGILLAGLDKFFDLLTDWSMYLSPLAERVLPVNPDGFLRGVGVLEMAMGLAILTRWPRLGAYALSAWLLGIVVNLALAAHFWDLVLRDVEAAAAAFALARLGEWRAEVSGDLARPRGPELRPQGARI